MAQQPSGTVTLVFTDIEGSTRLLHELGQDPYREALTAHRRIVRDAFARHAGYEIDYDGDAFFYAFSSAADAIAAVEQAMHALKGGPVRIRVGVHTGEPGLDPPKYVGLDVHKAARIMAAGHGGQVLLSSETRELAKAPVTDLGEHRLKDFDPPIGIFQLGSERFPPLKTISNTNLPRPASSFVGRQQEVEDVASLLRGGARLLTLTGPGGSGKTRLAIEAAAELVPEFKAGVFWVGLAPLRDPALVGATIAQTLGAKDRLADHIGERELLLLIDNLEQVVAAAPELAALVEACPNLRLLSTSRELLRVRGEVEYPVLPLAEPEAVELFCARAGAEPDETVHGLCRALDNLPLALELAAARANVLSPKQILERLSKRLDLLKGGRDADPRQQTLRATVEWSYELLTSEEQGLFTSLSVFAGGCTLEAAEEIANADLDTLQSLLHKSLLRHTEDRFWMLQTIREYAAGRLDDETCLHHAEWFLALAEEAKPELMGAAQALWLARLNTEHDNLRAALVFLRRSGRSALEVRLAGAFWRFWYLRGFLNEGQNRLEEILASAGGDLDVEHEKILYGGAVLAHRLGDYDRAEKLAAKRLAISRARGDLKLIASSLFQLGMMVDAKGDHKGALPLMADGVALARKAGDKVVLAMALNNFGDLARSLGDDETARSRFEEALALHRELSDTKGTAGVLSNLSELAQLHGKVEEAKAFGHEALDLAHGLGDKEIITWCLQNLSEQAASEGKADRAARLLGATDALREDTGHAPQPSEQRQLARIMALLGTELNEHLAAARTGGHAMTLDEAVAYALEPED
jgi:predicted ATPase